MSIHSIFPSRRRRAVLDERQGDEAAEYFRSVKAAVADMGELGPDADADPDAPTTEIAVIPAAPLPDIRQRPTVDTEAPGWTEQDAREHADELTGRFEAVRDNIRTEVADAYGIPRDAFEPTLDGQLPVPRRRHLPAVGTWFAEHLLPAAHRPIPALGPDALRGVRRLTSGPFDVGPEFFEDQYSYEDGPRTESGRLVLEAAASTRIFALPAGLGPQYFPAQPTAVDPHPDDFVEWLRAELADTYVMCDEAAAGLVNLSKGHINALKATYFRGAEQTFDRLNAMTLPGWTGLENALYNTGVFAS